jgi:hypothetical protein
MSALGAGTLAVAVFLPWYRVSSIVHASFAQPAARSLMRLSEQQALPYMKTFLLILAGLALLDALLPLVRAGAPIPGGAGGSVALLGAVAAACALYRILDPPALTAETVSLSLLEGPWLALLAALTMMLGGMWPRRVESAAAMSDVRAHGAWPGVSG